MQVSTKIMMEKVALQFEIFYPVWEQNFTLFRNVSLQFETKNIPCSFCVCSLEKYPMQFYFAVWKKYSLQFL